MLRELNDEEMMMVSGGIGDSQEPPEGFDGQAWEWEWALSDPLVMAQIMGGAGYDGEGSYVSSGLSGDSSVSGITITPGSGDLSYDCCSLLGINWDLFRLTITPEGAKNILPFPFSGPNTGVTGWVGDVYYQNGAPGTPPSD